MIAVYTLTDPVDGRVRYVGFTRVPPSMRLTGHMTEARRWIRGGKVTSNKKKVAWLASLIEKGLKPVLTVVEEGPDASETKWVERLAAGGADLLNAGMTYDTYPKRSPTIGNQEAQASVLLGARIPESMDVEIERRVAERRLREPHFSRNDFVRSVFLEHFRRHPA